MRLAMGPEGLVVHFDSQEQLGYFADFDARFFGAVCWTLRLPTLREAAARWPDSFRLAFFALAGTRLPVPLFLVHQPPGDALLGSSHAF